MLPVLLFILYTGFFAYLLCKIKFIRKSVLPRQWICGLFLLKIIAGCFYGYIHTKSIYYPSKIDTWKFYFESLPLTELLKENPRAFLDNLLGNGYPDGGSGFFEKTNSYWNDLRHNLMTMLMSIFNVLSGKNYYINIIFFNFITFFGVVAFYRFCKAFFSFPEKPFVILVFLLPSFVFWSSGFHKEGLVFTAIALMLYYGYKICYGKKWISFSLLFCLAIIPILLLRSYLLLFLMPYLLIWILFNYLPTNKILPAYILATALFIFLFFNLSKFHPKLDLPLYTSNAQKEFLQLGGNTAIRTEPLAPSPQSFLQHLPESAKTAFFAPGLQLKSGTYLPTLLENLAVLFFFILALCFRKKNALLQNTTLFFLFFSIATLLFLGLTVPVTGAIIRYKSIIYPFLWISLSSIIEWPRLKILKIKLN